MANEVSANIKDFIDNGLNSYLFKAMTDACAIVRNDAITRAPRKTGNLKRSIDFKVSEDGSEGVVFSKAKYAPYIEVGTGIYAKEGNGRKTPWVYPCYITNADIDNFKLDGKNGVRFFKTEGQKPRPFLEPALTSNKSRINKCFEGLF